MFFSLFFLSVIVTTFIHFSVADISLDPDNTNLFFDSDNNQLPSGGSSLWDADVGLGDPTFLTDSDPILFNNDQTDSFELAEVGDFCNAPPSKRARRDTAPNVCPPSGRQGQDQAIVNQLTIPNLLDIFSLKPKKKAPFTEPLGNPPFGASPTGEDGNPCPAERPVHLCCLDTNMRWAEVAGLHINYFTLKFCLAGKFHRAD